MPCQKYKQMEAEFKIMWENYRHYDNKGHDIRHSKDWEKSREISSKAGSRATELNHEMALHRATCPDCKDAVPLPAKLD